MGECGLRGGYMETLNLDPFVESQLLKLKSIELCSNTVGQIATLLSIDPPQRGTESDACVDQYKREEN